MKDIYDKTIFKVYRGSKVFEFDYKAVPNEPPFLNPFLIITGWNPMNVRLPLEENNAKNGLLFKNLIQSEYLFDPAIGFLGEHTQESYCIYDITLEDAIAMGKQYEQYAIFYSDGKIVGYYDAVTTEPILVNPQGR